MSLSIWLQEFFEADPVHFVIYTLLLAIIIYLLTSKSYKPAALAPVVLSQNEKEQIIKAWKPNPLVPKALDYQQHKLDISTIPTVEGAYGPFARINGNELVNFNSYSFLGFATSDSIKESARNALKTYGCGACGPRGFYGTLDVHLDFERKISQFFGTENSILYSSGFACISSGISTFALRNDIIICDSSVKHSIQTGMYLSRSKVQFFRHNDANHAKELMAAAKALEDKKGSSLQNRRFLIFETLYQNSGDVAPTKELVALAKQYKFRLVVDESSAVGVLGKTGRGGLEEAGVPISDVEIVLIDLGLSLSSVGGICTGRKSIVQFQRIHGSGYCFSAANPPYLVASCISAVNEIDEKPELLAALRENTEFARSELEKKIKHDILEVTGDKRSPIIPIHVAGPKRSGSDHDDSLFLQGIVDKAAKEGVLLCRAKFNDSQRALPSPFINFTVSAVHTKEHIQRAVDLIAKFSSE